MQIDGVGYCYDDVLLVPKYSDISSRQGSEISLSTDLGKGIRLDIPIVSSNMKDVTEVAMAKVIGNLGGLALFHRFTSFDEQLNMFLKTLSGEDRDLINHIGLSVGVQESDKSSVDEFVSRGCKIICVDVAHGHSKKACLMTEYIAKKYPQVLLIVGNVATAEGALFLHNAGADVCKAGVGGGSICSTRIETGNGVPQLTALDHCYQASRDWSEDLGIHVEYDRKFTIIADGGVRSAGDCVKGLVFADAIMLGGLLAGTDEAPAKTIMMNGRRYKEYSGSSTYKPSHVEGVSGLVPTKGPVKKVVEKLLQGIRSGLSYQGARNLQELRDKAKFVTISSAGLKESHPHDIFLKEGV